MDIQEAKNKLISHYGKSWFFICADCCGWTENDIIYQAKQLEL